MIVGAPSFRRDQRGYTIVEMMMAVAVLAIGASGVIAMQKVVATSNMSAKNNAIAMHVAQTWQERLAADGVRWNHPSPRLRASDLVSDTVWLGQVTTSPGVWLRPVFDPISQQGPAFDAFGNDVDPTIDPDAVKFCTHIRLSWLYPDGIAVTSANANVSGNGLIRTEVRVFWFKENANQLTAGPNGVCDSTLLATPIGQDVVNFHFVYTTSAVRQNTAR